MKINKLDDRSSLTINRNLCLWNPFTIRSMKVKKGESIERILIDAKDRIVVKYEVASKRTLPHSYDDLILYSLMGLSFKNKNQEVFVFDSSSHFNECLNLNFTRDEILNSLRRLARVTVEFERWYYKKNYRHEAIFHFLSFSAKSKKHKKKGKTGLKIRISLDHEFLKLVHPKKGNFIRINQKTLKIFEVKERRLFYFIKCLDEIKWDMKQFMERMGFNINNKSNLQPSRVEKIVKDAVDNLSGEFKESDKVVKLKFKLEPPAGIRDENKEMLGKVRSKKRKIEITKKRKL